MIKKIIDTSPISVWKTNKWRSDMRAYTREFEKKFKQKSHVISSLGNIYAIKYITDQSIITDKYHFTPLIISFGRYKDDTNNLTYTRGLNLFYLTTAQQLELLEEVYKHRNKSDVDKVKQFFNIHEKWIKIVPSAFKNLEEKRISVIKLIEDNEWGIIPLLKKDLFGTFNLSLLTEDFVKENKVRKIYKKAKDEPMINENEDDESYEEEISVNSTYDLDFDDI